MVVSNRNLLFKGSIFRGYVSFKEGTPNESQNVNLWEKKSGFTAESSD